MLQQVTHRGTPLLISSKMAYPCSLGQTKCSEFSKNVLHFVVQIKLWRIPESGLTRSGLSEPELVLSSQPRRIETVDFHPAADNILATSSANFLVIWDLVKAQDLLTFAVSLLIFNV